MNFLECKDLNYSDLWNDKILVWIMMNQNYKTVWNCDDVKLLSATKFI